MMRRGRESDVTEDQRSLPANEALEATVVSGSGITASGTLAAQAITLASYIVIGRLVTPEEFGQVAAGSVLLVAAVLFAESGMAAAVIHRRTEIPNAASTAFVSLLVGGVVLSLLTLALAPLVGLFFQSHEIGVIAASLSAYPLLQSLGTVPMALLQRGLAFRRRALIAPVGALVAAAVGITLTALGFGVWGLVGMTYASSVGAVATAWAVARWRPALRLVSFRLWRELVAFGRHVLVAEIFVKVRSQMSTLIIGRVLGEAALGQYRYAGRVAALPVIAVTGPLGTVLFPVLAQIAGHEERVRLVFLSALRLTMVLMLPLCLLLVPLGESLVVLFFGEQWRPAGQVLQIIAIAPIAGTITGQVLTSCKGAGRPDRLPRIELFSFVATAIGLASFAQIGLLAVALGGTLAAFATAAYATVQIRNVLGVRIAEIAREIVPSAIAALLATAVVYLVEYNLVRASEHGTAAGLGLLALEALLGLGLYVAVLPIVAPTAARDAAQVARSTLRRVRARRDPIAASGRLL